MSLNLESQFLSVKNDANQIEVKNELFFFYTGLKKKEVRKNYCG